jgi:hypothetical protein
MLIKMIPDKAFVVARDGLLILLLGNKARNTYFDESLLP